MGHCRRHPPHTRRSFAAFDIQFAVERRLTLVTVWTQIVGPQNLCFSHHGKDSLAPHLNVLCRAAAWARDLALVRNRRGEQLDQWLSKAKASGIKELAAYARGLETDYAAVKAGLALEWSNGQTEGQVNKLKLLKRQLDGRATFDLLRLRVLHMA